MASFFNRPHISVDYREEAKSYCSLEANRLALIYLVYFIISVVVIVIDNLTGSTTTAMDIEYKSTWFNSLFTIICGGAFAISFAHIAKSVHNGLEPKIEDLFEGFKDFTRAIVISLLQVLFIALWTLLLIVPGIIKSFAYSMSFYVALDNKELSAKECLKESERIMKGNKWQLFCLTFSYIGWILLSCLTFGILFLWVMPRIQQAIYLFYLDVSGKGLELEQMANVEALAEEVTETNSQL